MGKYGKCAEMATRLLQRRTMTDPIAAWNKAALAVFPDSESSRKKCCPKNAFLGLCEEGMVRGVAAGNYTRSSDNKRYALNAIKLLQKDASLSGDMNELWKRVQRGDSKKHNSQMDVVITLWGNGLVEL